VRTDRPRRPMVAATLGALLVTSALTVPVSFPSTSVAATTSPMTAPAVVTGVGGVPHDFPKTSAVSVRWWWQPGVASYRVVVAKNSSFSKGRHAVVVPATSAQPPRGYQSTKVAGLKSGTRYWVRVRAIGADGSKGPWSTTARTATAAKPTPSKARFRVKPGKKPGSVTFRWKKRNLRPSKYVLTIASSMFYPGSEGLARRGRHQRKIVIPGKRSSYTVSPKVAKKAGVRVGSGDTLYYRFVTKYPKKAKKRTQLSTGLHGTLTAPGKKPRKGAKVRVATYNVASATVTAPETGVGRPWLNRVAKVAKIINDSGAGIVGLQELGPGNQIDGHLSMTRDPVRQTDSLVTKLNKDLERAPWRLVRAGAYTGPGVPQGTQGARILYDASRYELLTDCDDDVPASTSCTISTPILPGETTMTNERRAAYAEFRDRSTGTRFYVVSAHLDYRRGATAAQQRAYDLLRKKQAKRVVRFMQSINTDNRAVILTGDLNGWQNDVVSGNPAHDALLKAGYYDASATKKRKGDDLLTSTSWRTSIPRTSLASRLDYIMVRGVKGSLSYVNTMVASDAARASDHSLVMADLRIPKKAKG